MLSTPGLERLPEDARGAAAATRSSCSPRPRRTRCSPTIVDRCHRFDFQRPSLEQITTVLKRIAAAEEIEADDRALAMIARSASGSFRDAIGTLDQLVTYGGKQVSFEDVMELLDVADAELIFAATDAVIGRDPGAALRRVQELSESGRDPVQFMRDLTAPPAPPDRGPDARRAARLLQRDRRPGAAARGPGARPAPGRGGARDRPAGGRDRGREGGRRSAHAARAGAAEGAPARAPMRRSRRC